MAPEPSASAALLPVSVERSDVAPSPKPRVPSKVEPAAANKNSLPAKPPTALPMCASRSQWAHATYPYDQTPRCGRYNPDVSIFAIVTAWSGTVLPLVLSLPSFYILVGLHALFCYLDVIDTLDEEIEWSLFGAQPSAHSCAPILLRALCYPCHAPPHQACPPPFWSSSSSSTAPSATNDFLRCTHIVSASAAPPCSGWPWSHSTTC